MVGKKMLSSNVLCTFLTNTQLTITLWILRQLLWIRHNNIAHPLYFYQKTTGIKITAEFQIKLFQRPFQKISFSKAARDSSITNFIIAIIDTRYNPTLLNFFHLDGFKVPWPHTIISNTANKFHSSHRLPLKLLRFIANLGSGRIKKISEAHRESVQGIFHNFMDTHSAFLTGSQFLSGQLLPSLYSHKLTTWIRTWTSMPTGTTTAANIAYNFDNHCNHISHDRLSYMIHCIMILFTIRISDHLHSNQLYLFQIKAHHLKVTHIFSSCRPPEAKDQDKKRLRDGSYATAVMATGSFDLISAVTSYEAAYAITTTLPSIVEISTIYTSVLTAAGYTGDIQCIHTGALEYINRRQAQHSPILLSATFQGWCRHVAAALWNQSDVQSIAAYYGKFLRGLWLSSEHGRNRKDIQDLLNLLVGQPVPEPPRHDILARVEAVITERYNTALANFEGHFTQATCSLSAAALNIANEPYGLDHKNALAELTCHISIYQCRVPKAVQTPMQATPMTQPAAVSSRGSTKAVAAFAPPGGVMYCPRQQVPVYTVTEAEDDMNLFRLQRESSVLECTYSDAAVRTHCLTVANKACAADAELGRGDTLIIHGAPTWTELPSSAENTMYTKAIYHHICRRLGWYNESPHAGAPPTNPVRPKLHHEVVSSFRFARDGVKTVVSIQLEVPITFGCVGTARHDLNSRCIVAEIQRIKLPLEFSPQRQGKTNNHIYSEVTVQVLPYHRHSELRNPELTPCIGCITGIPMGFNATPLACACLSAIRQWIRESSTVDLTEVLLLTDIKWTSLPKTDYSKVPKHLQSEREFKDKSGKYAPRQELFVKLIYMGGDGTPHVRNSSAFVRLKSDLEGHARSETLHINGFRLRYHTLLEQAKATLPQYQWIRDKTPCTIIRNIKDNISARHVLNAILAHEPHIYVSHEIGQIVILPSLEYQTKPNEDMKATQTAAVIIWLTRAYELDPVTLEQHLQGPYKPLITVSTEDDLPGREKIVEAADWFHTAPDKIIAPLVDSKAPAGLMTPTTRILGGADTSPGFTPMDVGVGTTSSTLTGTVTGYGADYNAVTLHNRAVSSAEWNPHTALVQPHPDMLLEQFSNLLRRMDKVEAENREFREASDRTRTADLANAQAVRAQDRQVADDREATLLAHIQEVRTFTKAEVFKAAETGERLRTLGRAKDRLGDAYQRYSEAKVQWEGAREWLDAIPVEEGSERRQATLKVKTDSQILEERRKSLRQARLDLETTANEAGVDIGATLTLFNE